MSNNNSETISQQKNSSVPRQKIESECPEVINRPLLYTKIKDIVQNTLRQKLLVTQDKSINSAKDISEAIKNRLKEQRLNRYKFVVQTYCTEQKNQGINISNKCFYDEQRDICITEEFRDDEALYFVVVYAVFVY